MNDTAPATTIPDMQLFPDVFNASPIGIAIENLEGQPLFVNPAFCSFLGFSQEELRNKHCVDFSPREDAEKDWVLFQQLRAGSIDRYQLEKRYFRQDGSLVWGRLSISLLRSRPPLVLAMVEDITEKKRAEEARFQHSAIVESSEDAIVSATLEGVIASWNAGAQRLFGYTESEVVGRSITIIVPPELLADEDRILETINAGRSIKQFETIRLTKTGERINVSLSISPIKDSNNRIVGCSGIVRDITDRKQAEEHLRESEQRLRMAAEAGKMFSFEWDLAADLVVRSPERVKVLGATEPLRLSYEQFLNSVHSDDRSKFSAAIAGLTPENPTTEVIYRLRNSDGSLVWLRSSGRAFFDGEGRLLRVIGMVADITDLKRAEGALSGMTRKLVEAQEQERARIGRELHDDITQRLAMLSVELQLLQENPSELQERVREFRKRMLEISNDVQVLSHELHSSKLEHLGVIAGIKSWCREFAQRQKVEINCIADVSSVLSPEIGLTLFRVLQEALHNAIKHSGVRRFEVQLREFGTEVLLVINDSGRGFDLETELQGTGLGLTSMRERVRLVNGTFSIDSKPNRGTTIYVRVPLTSEQDSQRVAV